MNKIKLIAGIFLILTVFTSCNNEPIDSAINLNDFTTTPNGPIVFKADFSGATWNGTIADATVSANSISIGATREDGSTFAIAIQGGGVGTYQANANIIAYTPTGSQYGYWSVNTANATENTGSITITNINTTNHTISGGFTYKGYWSDSSTTSIIPVQFTNGVFTNIPYSGSTPPVSNDTFFAKVDGTEFVEDAIDVAATISSGFPDSYSIVAKKNNGDDIGLSIAQSLAVGTYQIIGPFGDQVNSNCLLSGVFYTGDSGSITITSKTVTHMTGTFTIVEKNGTTSATKSVTEGAFDVDLP